MHTKITKGVAIDVRPEFKGDISNVGELRFIFMYRITIENKNNFPVKLLRRAWHIFDSLNKGTHISGEGVIGEQPIINPGESLSYSSWSEINSEIGFMQGHYIFSNLEEQQLFEVNIPRFPLIFPGRLN